MDGENSESATETESHSSNGVNGASHSSDSDAIRAAFLSGAFDGDGKSEEKSAPKGESKVEDKDDDSDLDADADEVDADADEKAEDEDDDSDLDEDEEKSEDEDEDKNVDADTAKRLAAVRKTDKRLREQREKQFEERENAVKASERAIRDEVSKLEQQWKPRIEAAEKFERAAARINVDPVGVLNALGLKPERYEHAAQILYTLSKAKDDPKAQAAAAQLMRERERDDEIERLKKRDEERDQREKQRDEEAAVAAQGQKLMTAIVKTASDKTPLAKTYLKSDPEGAHADIARIASKLIDETGKMPEPKAVIIAFEKERRTLLRKMGIDPKKVSPNAANAAIEKSATKTTPKKTAQKSTKVDEDKPMTKADFISGKFD